MPSRYEPCGLGQMYALRYGAVPVVRATGGLDDTVVDFEARSHSGTGFKFGDATAEALEGAVSRALATYTAPEAFSALARRGMQQDFSWGSSARSYRALYQSVLAVGGRA
jgi:starch synthase